jgi:CheY-like chemotaxis protein
MTIEEFERGQNEKDGSLSNTDNTSLDDNDGDSSIAITAIGQYVRNINGKIQVTSESTGTLISLELPFAHSHPPPPVEDPRKLRNLFHPTSRPSRGAPITTLSPPSKNLKPINRSSIGASSTNPFLVSESAKVVHRQSRTLSSESTSPTLGSSLPSHRSSRPTPSTSPSPPLHSTIPKHRSSRGTPSPSSSPPSESAKPARRELGKRGNPANIQTQAFWERSDSPSPPPDKALPPRPDEHQHDHATTIPHSLGISPLSTVQESMDNNIESNSVSNLSILIADDDALAVRNLNERLSQWGHSVTTASDGQECHDRFELHSDKTDVILMELKVCHPTAEHLPLIQDSSSLPNLDAWR